MKPVSTGFPPLAMPFNAWHQESEIVMGAEPNHNNSQQNSGLFTLHRIHHDLTHTHIGETSIMVEILHGHILGQIRE